MTYGGRRYAYGSRPTYRWPRRPRNNQPTFVNGRPVFPAGRVTAGCMAAAGFHFRAEYPNTRSALSDVGRAMYRSRYVFRQPREYRSIWTATEWSVKLIRKVTAELVRQGEFAIRGQPQNESAFDDWRCSPLPGAVAAAGASAVDAVDLTAS